MSKLSNAVSIPEIKLSVFKLTLVGDSSLICHRWSEKAKKQMLDKQMGTACGPKARKNPEKDFLESLYWLDGMPANPTIKDVKKAKFGFPAVAFKSAAVDASLQTDGGKKTVSRAAFHVLGELVAIEGTPEPREDMVKVGMGTADLRYRGEFKKWKAELTIRHNPDVLSAAQITNLFNMGGFGVGVGEWRPQRDGSYGMFHVARSEAEAKRI